MLIRLKMKKRLSKCFSTTLEVSFLTSEQLITLLVINITSMGVNVTANALFIYILIKTEQLSNITFKLIFSLTTSDMLMTLTSQSLLAVLLHGKYCSFKIAFIFLSVFFYHFGSSIVALLGVDRYLRIKYYSNFRSIWTTKVAATLIIVISFLEFLQALIITLSSILEENKNILPIYITIDSIIIGTVAFLQIKSIRMSNALHNESTVSRSERINKKITKLSMRIMLLYSFFASPHLIVHLVRCRLENQLSGYEKYVLEFILLFSMIFGFTHLLVDAILFLKTNVKAKWFLKNYMCFREITF